MIRPLDSGFREDIDARARSLLIVVGVVSILGALAHRAPIDTAWRAWLLAPFRPALVLSSHISATIVETISGQKPASRDVTASVAERTLFASRAASLERELNQLRATIALPDVMPMKGTVATVTGQFVGLGQRMILIDRGTAVDIRVGSLVLAAIGNRVAVVGRVVEAGPTVSKVMTLLDPALRISASLTGTSGYVLSGAPDRSLAKLDFVPRDQSVAIGDEIVTSEDGTIYPAGLHLGSIASIGSSNGAFHDLLVEPCASFDHLRYVWVTRPVKSR